jgi:hypothetical protein
MCKCYKMRKVITDKIFTKDHEGSCSKGIGS